jgi:hypothetical protein
MLQTLSVALEVGDILAFAADITLAARVVLIGAHPGDMAAIGLHLETTVLGTQNTTSFFPFGHDKPRVVVAI